MFPPRAFALVLLGCVIAACDAPDDAPLVDSPAMAPAAPPVGAPATSAWAGELGEALLVPADGDSLAVVVYPSAAEAAAIRGLPITLQNAAGDSGVVHATIETADSLQCGELPVLRLAGNILPGWTVGLQRQSVRPVAMDSLEGMSRADSSRITTELARLASMISAHEESRFEALPFAVARARVIRADDREILLGQLVRRVPQEAAPVEERTFIIAERANGRGPYTIEYSQRSSGSEETTDYFEVLSATRADDRLLVLLARDRPAQTTYVVLERSPAGVWRAVWERLLAC